MNYNATITKIEIMNEKLREFTIKLDEGDSSFVAGQFAVLGLKDADGNLIRRAYSIVSAPADGDRHFYIVLKYTPDIYDKTKSPKALTPLLFSAKKGDRIFLSQKALGHFTLNLANDSKQLIYVATGTGLAPFRGLLRAHEDKLKTTKIALLHGVRSEKDLGYADELKLLAEKYPQNFFYFPIVSRPSENWKGQKGRVDAIMKSGEIQKSFGEKLSAETSVFFCGSPLMIKDGIEIMKSLNVPAENIHKEVQ